MNWQLFNPSSIKIFEHSLIERVLRLSALQKYIYQNDRHHKAIHQNDISHTGIHQNDIYHIGIHQNDKYQNDIQRNNI